MGFSKVDIIGNFNKSSFSETGDESLVGVSSRGIWNKGIKERDHRTCFEEFGAVVRGDMSISEVILMVMVMMILVVGLGMVMVVLMAISDDDDGGGWWL